MRKNGRGGIIIILVIGIVFRFWNFDKRWVFNQDQGRDATIGLYALKNGIWPEIGSPSSAGPFNFGPWYDWIIMFWEKVIPTINGPWIGFGLLSVMSIYFYYLAGGWVAALIAAVAVGSVENSPDMLNTVIVGWSGALAWMATRILIKTENWKWGLVVGFGVGLSINFHFQSWGLMAIPLAIFLINKFDLKKRFCWGAAMLTGWIGAFLPLIIFDLKSNGIWIRSVIEYYTVGVNKFYVPVRWLTELRDFWPQLLGQVTVGIGAVGYGWVILGVVAGIMMFRKKRKINRFWWVLGLVFLIQIILMRNYKGVRSREYLIAFHGMIILTCTWIVNEWFRFKKFLGVVILGIVMVLAGINNYRNILESPSQAQEISEMKRELDMKVGEKVSFSQYKQSDMVSMPLFYLYYRENRIGDEGTKLEICDGNRYECPKGEVLNKNNYRIYLNQNINWDRLTPENIYDRLMVNYNPVKPVISGKYVTIVNPVRSRELWKDRSLKPIEDQYGAINGLGLKATWLIQDDGLGDQELVKEIKNFDDKQELGVFLEISKDLAYKSRVYFDEQRPWYDPGVVFLSAYSREDRIKLIDKMMDDFKGTFGYLPKSAGAWWIDSYSQQYLENKYGIKTVMIVADQKTTDNYGIWGQWWGVPYHPSPDNILVPGRSKTVVVQWAQRDLVKAYSGEGKATSNYSLQANDYTSLGLNINYFKNLASKYLGVKGVGQITVGLETGMESVGQEKEYERQLKWLSDSKIESITMSQFSEVYGSGNPETVILGDWTMTSGYRENKNLGERTDYKNNLVFRDYYDKDESSFLNRIYKTENLIEKRAISWEMFLIIPALMVGFLLGPKWGGLAVVGMWLADHLRYTVINNEKMVGFLFDSFRFVGINLKTGLINTDLTNLVAKSMLRIKFEYGYLTIWVIAGLLIRILWKKLQPGKKKLTK